jgi:hypothetical protein
MSSKFDKKNCNVIQLILLIILFFLFINMSKENFSRYENIDEVADTSKESENLTK